MKSILPLFILFFSSIITAQEDTLLPFLSNEKYGIVTASGETIFEAQYDKFKIYDEKKVIALLRENVWEFFSLHNRKSLNVKIEVEPNKSDDCFFILYAKRGKENKTKRGSLLIIIDRDREIEYYANPLHVKQEVKAYPEVDNYRKSLFDIVKVVKEDGQVNFLDSIGNEILDKDVIDGEVLNNSLLSILGENQYAIFDGKTQITPFQYSDVSSDSYGEIINAWDSESNLNVFLKNGEKFDFAFDDINYLDDNIIINNESGGSIFNISGQLIKHFPEHYLEYDYRSTMNLLGIKNSENKVGIVNLKGDLLYDIKYDKVKLYKNKIILDSDNLSIVLDSNFQEILRVPNVESLSQYDSEKFYKFSKLINGKPLYGLVDQNGELVLEAKYKILTVQPNGNFAFGGDNKSGDLILLQGDTPKVIAQFNGHSYFNSNEPKISYYNNIYDFEYLGLNGYNSRLYNVKKNDDGKVLQDLKGDNALDIVYNDIIEVVEPVTKRSLYFCEKSDDYTPLVDVFNDELKNVIPNDFRLYEYAKGGQGLMHGAIAVNHKEDRTGYRRVTRIGIVDYNGNWIVGPVRGQFFTVSENLIVLWDKYAYQYYFYYPESGKLEKRNYNKMFFDESDKFVKNRIKVNIENKVEVANPPVAIEGEELIFEDTEIVASEDRYSYSFIDMNGEESIGSNYCTASDFHPIKKIAIVGVKNEIGTIESRIIDTLGNVKFSIPYENVEFIGGSNFIANKNRKYALLDSLGELQTDFIFDEIESHRDEQFFQAKIGNDKYVLSQTGAKVKIDVPGRVRLQNLSKEYFLVTNKYSGKEDVKFIILTKDLKVAKIIEGVFAISTSIFDRELPNGYVAIYRDKLKKLKPYLYNLTTDTELKN